VNQTKTRHNIPIFLSMSTLHIIDDHATGKLWESHGNGTKIRSIMGILIGMGNNLCRNGNDPAISVGINSH